MADEACTGEVFEENISKMPKEKSPSAFIIFTPPVSSLGLILAIPAINPQEYTFLNKNALNRQIIFFEK